MIASSKSLSFQEPIVYFMLRSYSREDNNARNGSREKKQRKAKTKMGEIHHVYVWYDGSSKQSGGGQTSISQRHLGSDVLARICSEKKKLFHAHLFQIHIEVSSYRDMWRVQERKGFPRKHGIL